VKLRHAAALPLFALGWYLMVPPRLLSGSSAISDIPPLEQWQILHSFDTAKSCQDGLEVVVKGFKQDANHKPNDAGASWKFQMMSDAECIASDDPRLKSK